MEHRLPPPQQLAATGVMAILRAPSADRFTAIAEALAQGGITCLEITLNTPGALDALASVRRHLPGHIAAGVGTAITPEQVRQAAAAGAQFVVSPNVDPDVIACCVELGLPCFPGAFTATEVVRAWDAGATAVKIFPAAATGPEYLAYLRGPLPHIPLVPTGGVPLEHIPAYLGAGALAVGLGGPLLGDAASGGDLTALTQRARRAVEAAAGARKGQA